MGGEFQTYWSTEGNMTVTQITKRDNWMVYHCTMNIHTVSELNSNVWFQAKNCYKLFHCYLIPCCVITNDYITPSIGHTNCQPPPFMLKMCIQWDNITLNMQKLNCTELDVMNKNTITVHHYPLLFTAYCNKQFGWGPWPWHTPLNRHFVRLELVAWGSTTRCSANTQDLLWHKWLTSIPLILLYCLLKTI